MRSSLPTALLLASLLGCGAPPSEQLPEEHGDPALPEVAGRRSRVQSDLPAETASELAGKLDALEDVLDAAFPFLPAPSTHPRTLIVSDPARYQLHARDHGVDGLPGAFVCAQGEVHLLWRVEDWEPFGPPFPLEPRCRPLAASTFRRRLLGAMGQELPPTWLEDGLVQVFVELAAHELGEAEAVERATVRRLLDAYLPLFLGEPPVLAEVVTSPAGAKRRKMGAEPTAWAVVRHLLARREGPRVLELALARHAGRVAGSPAPGAVVPVDWTAAETWLQGEEEAFLRGLQSALLRELLVTVASAPTPVDRWEAAGALRLIGNLDIDADLPVRTLQEAVRNSEALLRENPPPLRFLDLFQGEIAAAAGEKNRLAAFRRVRTRAVKELERRSMGFGHPALEQGRLNLGRTIERAVESAAEVAEAPPPVKQPESEPAEPPR